MCDQTHSPRLLMGMYPAVHPRNFIIINTIRQELVQINVCPRSSSPLRNSYWVELWNNTVSPVSPPASAAWLRPNFPIKPLGTNFDKDHAICRLIETCWRYVKERLR